METLTIQDTRRQEGAIGFATDPSGVCEPRDASSAPGTRKKPDTETDTKVSPDRLWHVIVWNDPINLMSYVTFVLQKLFGYSLELATKLMLQVHNDGRSIVATVEREKAEQHVTRLHQYGLQATLEKQEC